MSLKQLKKHLLVQDYRATQIEEIPDAEYPQFVRDKLAAFNKKQQRRAEREAAKAKAIADLNKTYGKLAQNEEA